MSREAEAVLADLLDERWSCRAFRPDAVPRETIERLLELAQRAPSWCNTQPWQVLLTTGEGTERFRQAMSGWAENGSGGFDIPAPAEYRGVYQDRRRGAARQLYEAVGVTWGDRAASRVQSLENFRFFGAPHVAILTIPDEQGAYAGVDAGVYIGTFLLAAQALGLGAIPQAALAGYGAQVREYFGVEPGRSVVAGISFGYPDSEHVANGYRTPRASLDDAVRWVDA